MALAHLGISRSQQNIRRSLKLRKGFGALAPNIVALRSRTIEVVYQIGGAYKDIRQWLHNDVPVIAFVQAGELPHWRGIRSQHAVLIVGIDEHEVTVHDPALERGPTSVPAGDFLLAWGEMDHRYAVLYKA
jgi:uncharacterized protein YvpB